MIVGVVGRRTTRKKCICVFVFSFYIRVGGWVGKWAGRWVVVVVTVEAGALSCTDLCFNAKEKCWAAVAEDVIRL